MWAMLPAIAAMRKCSSNTRHQNNMSARVASVCLPNEPHKALCSMRQQKALEFCKEVREEKKSVHSVSLIVLYLSRQRPPYFHRLSKDIQT